MGKRLNLGIVAHVDAGKTTLTEQILFQSGAIRTAGSVDEGTASTDSMPIERERGISVKSGSASVLWNGVRLNLIDAPGHSDFLSEVERSLCVLDLAVLVVSAVEGVQPQTELLIDAFERANMPCVVFLNKADRMGADCGAVFAKLQKRFHRPCLLLSQPVGEGSDGCRVERLSGDDSGFAERAVEACGDDGLLELFLEREEEAVSRLPGAIAEAAGAARLTPVLCGASKFGVGVPELLDAVTSCFHPGLPEQEELCARVYQVEFDRAMGKAAYVRLFSGELKNRQAVPVGEGEEKITRIRKLEGRRLVDGESVGAGEIAVLYGLSTVRAGDVLGTAPPSLRGFRLSTPLMLVKVEPRNPEQLMELVRALQELSDEDPSLGFTWVREKQEIQLSITGKIQIEVLGVLLRERYEIEAAFGEPSVIYRETPLQSGIGFDSYTMPKPCWAVLKFELEPLPRGSGLLYESRVSNQKILYRYQTHVETAVPRALKQGLHGWEVTDLKITLVDGSYHHVHTHPLDFFVATPMAIMDGLRNTGTKLLEPILKVTFSAPEEYLGKAVSLAVAHRGEFEGPELENGRFRLTACIPAAEAMDLPVEFAAATGGSGSYGAVFSHYADCPEGMGSDRERIGVNPLDRPKFILAARSALAEEISR